MASGPKVLSIDAFPIAGQRMAWRQALADLGLGCTLGAHVEPSGEIGVLRSPGGAVLSRLRSTRQCIASTGLPTGKPGEPLIAIFHHRGRGEVSSRQRTSEFADGDVSICDRGNAFAIDLREDFELLMLSIPRERILARFGRARVQFPVVLGTTISAAAVRPVMRTLTANFETLGDSDFISAEIAVTELLVGALMGEGRTHQESATQVQAAHFRRVTAAIETRLADPDLSTALIAAQETLSQRYLQKLFELQDTTFSDYVRHRRLERARLELGDPAHSGEAIAEIAYRWGFRDPAYFSRAFTTAYGQSPRAFRTATTCALQVYPLRGRPIEKSLPHNAVVGRPHEEGDFSPANDALASMPVSADRHRIFVGKDTVHWGYLSRSIAPVLRVPSGAEVTIETLTQHAFDDYERMIKGDAAAESVFGWTSKGKNVDRRGAGPMNASIFGRGAGEGFGVHIFTGPVFVEGAEPGDVLEIDILDIAPRPSANPDFAGRYFASNASAWWGFQYSDLIEEPRTRETITIYEIDRDGEHAHAVHSYRWTPQVDPFGVRHDTMDYPGVPVDQASVEKRRSVLSGVRIPLRPHFGCMAVAPRESDLVDSIPPGYFGGNLDNWRAGKGSTLYLPVAVPGALFSVGDGHLAQGDGEIGGTALEASLTGRFRLTVHKKAATQKSYLRGLCGPLIETRDEFVLHGFSYPNYLRDLGRHAQSEVYKKSSLSKALRSAFRITRRFLMETWALSEDEALSLMSVGVDFGITQVADGNWGVHATIRKAMFV